MMNANDGSSIHLRLEAGGGREDGDRAMRLTFSTQNEPNYRRFCAQNGDLAEKRTQTKPILRWRDSPGNGDGEHAKQSQFPASWGQERGSGGKTKPIPPKAWARPTQRALGACQPHGMRLRSGLEARMQTEHSPLGIWAGNEESMHGQANESA